MLLHGLVRVQRGKFSFNDGLGSLDGCFDEVLVHFQLRTVFLDSLEVGFGREVLDDLEFFVPITHRPWVVPEEWANRLVDTLRVGHFDTFFGRYEPLVDLLGDR